MQQKRYHRIKPTHGNTYTVLLTDWRHPQSFTQNPKEKESCDFPERVAQRCTLVLDSNPSLPRCGPRLAPRAGTWSRSAPRMRLPALSQRGLLGREIVDARGRRGEWWMLRPADVVSGPQADRPAPGRRLALPRCRRQQGPGRGCADSTLSSLTRRKNSDSLDS